MRILTRYVLRSLVAPFVFALSSLTLLMLLNELGKRFGKLVGKGLEWTVIVEVFALSIPFILALTLPMAVLMAVLYAFNRMASDNEITAMKASGVYLPRLVAPVVAVAGLLALGMVWFNNSVLPESNHRLQVLISSISQKKPTFVLQERTINEVLDGEMYLQAARVERGTNDLWDVVIYDERRPEQSRTIYADSGSMALSEDKTDLYLILHSGYSQQHRRSDPDAFQQIRFREMAMRVPDVSNRLRRQDLGGYRGEREMSIPQLEAEVRGSRLQELAAEEESRWLAVHLTRRLLGREAPDGEAAGGPEPGGPAGGAAPGGEDTAGADGDVGPAERPPVRLDRGGGAGLERGGGRDTAADTPGERADTGAARRAADTPAQAADTPATPAVPGAAGAEADAAEGGPVEDAPPAGSLAAGSLAAGSLGAASLSAEDSLAAARDSVVAEARSEARRAVERMSTTAAPSSRFASLKRSWSSAVSRSNRYAVEIHKKYSIPAACIVFVLIGAPLAVRYRTAGVAMVVGASLLIFCAYYVSLVGGEELSEDLILSPFWAMWAPNVLFGGLGLVAMWRAVKVG